MKTPFGIIDNLQICFEYDKNDMDQTYMLICRDDKVISRVDADMAEDLYTILVGNEDWKNE